MKTHYHLLGLGIGPFHLALAALLEKAPGKECLFLDQKPHFGWHSELLFSDADMQTSFFKDFVTPIDPTSRHSFLNYLVEHGLFYSFMNTNRRVITRREFEQYAQWVSKNLLNLKFSSRVTSVDYDGALFTVKAGDEVYTADHLSVATGMVPRIPEEAKPFLGAEVFHAKSGLLDGLDLAGRRVIIIGGGQTGVEIFRNALKGKWGRPQDLKLISRRQNLEPLDESPFTNEYFSPHYAQTFFNINPALKKGIVEAQKLASDGNTPSYLEDLYKDLYFLKHVDKDPLEARIYPKRTLTSLTKNAEGGHRAHFKNGFLGEDESFDADIIILSTGFMNALPGALEGLKHLLDFDEEGRLIIDQSFRVSWRGSASHRIYALNFGRFSHGIAEPQTSLMAWRGAMIVNDLLGESFYRTSSTPTFIQYAKDQKDQ